jgi:hypothetical protein
VGKEFQFYGGYEPTERIRNRLDSDPEEDFHTAVPHRDILGILEDEEAWTKQDSIFLSDITELFEDFDYSPRESEYDEDDEYSRCRDRATPTNTTFRGALKELHQKGIVYSRTLSQKIAYQKVKDGELPPEPIYRFSMLYAHVAEICGRITCGNRLAAIGTTGYILSSLLYSLSLMSYWGMITFIIVFLSGHVLDYRDDWPVPKTIIIGIFDFEGIEPSDDDKKDNKG